MFFTYVIILDICVSVCHAVLNWAVNCPRVLHLTMHRLRLGLRQDQPRHFNINDTIYILLPHQSRPDILSTTSPPLIDSRLTHERVMLTVTNLLLICSFYLPTTHIEN